MADDKTPDTAVDEQKAIGAQEESQVTVEEQEQQQAAKEYGEDKNLEGQLTMHVRVAAPFREYYDGQAFSISANNLTGPFDILPKHHNFISLLTDGDLVIRGIIDKQQKSIKIAISGGIMHVKSDEIIVFLDV